MRASAFGLALCLLIGTLCPGAALVVRPVPRRQAVAGAVATLAASLASHASVAFADEPVVLTDEEMAARVALKQELLRRKSGGGGMPITSEPDYNPAAGVNLRSRSIGENFLIEKEKQDEYKKRDKMQRRDDMCELLGRGC